MGYYGWETIGLGFSRTLKGTLKRVDFNGNDGDWSFYVKPDPGFEWLLVDPGGHTNVSGTLECEVRPSKLGGVEVMGAAVLGEKTLHEMFDPCVGRTVVVEGPWVADCSHMWDDSDLGMGPALGFGQVTYNNGKTEIHPVLSVLVNRDDLVSHLPGALPLSRIQFFVFVDEPFTHFIYRPNVPPGSGQSRVATFQYPFPGLAPVSGGLGAPTPYYQIVHEENNGASKEFAVTHRGDSVFLQGTVVTGTTGYYWATIDLIWGSGPGVPGAPALQFLPVKDGPAGAWNGAWAERETGTARVRITIAAASSAGPARYNVDLTDGASPLSLSRTGVSVTSAPVKPYKDAIWPANTTVVPRAGGPAGVTGPVGGTTVVPRAGGPVGDVGAPLGPATTLTDTLVLDEHTSLFLYGAFNPAKQLLGYRVRYIRTAKDGTVLVDVMLVSYSVIR